MNNNMTYFIIVITAAFPSHRVLALHHYFRVDITPLARVGKTRRITCRLSCRQQPSSLERRYAFII
jgi:hypothetical protein